MLNASRIPKQSALDSTHWIPAKIGTGWDYASVLFVSALCCITSVYWTSNQLFSDLEAPLIVASMGAAAVLMFASPASPMASSWAFIVGNLLSALIGITVFTLLGNTPVSAGLAVSTAIIAMHFTHSMHPPGGATALFAIVGGSLVENLGYFYMVVPVALNLSVFFLFVRLHRWYLQNQQQKRQYTLRLHDAVYKHSAESSQQFQPLFVDDDIEQALTLVGGNPDVSSDYLKQVIENTLAHAQIRKLQETGYHALQINPPVVQFGDNLIDAWQLLHREHEGVVVVLYPGGKFVGVLTFKDFISLAEVVDTAHANSLEGSEKLIANIEQALLPSGHLENNRPEVCGQVARKVPQLTELNQAGSILVDGVSVYAALVDSNGIFQCLLAKNQ